jgi:hypothetical protein
MDWTDIAKDVAAAAPLLGSLVGGPAGGAIGGLIASALGTDHSPDAVKQALAVNPEAAVKLRQIEAEQGVALQGLAVQQAANGLAADTARLQAVNATMQAEAGAEHWPTYTWRPFIGFVAGVMVFGVYFVLPLVHVAVPPVPETVWLMLGGILGVASFFRGKMQADPDVPTINRG